MNIQQPNTHHTQTTISYQHHGCVDSVLGLCSDDQCYVRVRISAEWIRFCVF